MTDQAPDHAPEDRPATTPTATKRKRKTRVVKRTTDVPSNVAEDASAADAEASEPADAADPEGADIEGAEVSEHAVSPAAEPAADADEPAADSAPEADDTPLNEDEPEAATDPDEEPATDDVAPASHAPTTESWRRETAGRAWPTLGDYPDPPAAAAWTGTADTAWPEPELPAAERDWDKPAPAKRRELGRREAGLALAFLALGVASGVTIGSTVTVPLSPPAAVSHEATFERTIADAQQRTVTITVDSPDGAAGRGAGTIIGKDGIVITTNAVVRSPGGTIRVTTYNGRTLGGEFIGTDQTTGLTILRVRGLDAPGFTATSADTGAGARVAVIGQNNNATTSTVASPRQAVNTITGSVGVGTWTSAVRLTSTDDATATGGPIINDSGALVGIAVSGVTTGRPSDPERRQYGLDAGVAVTVARNIATTGVAFHGRLGADVTDENTGVLGARVTDVADPSPAKTARLRTDDVIVSYNGARIDSAAQLVAAVRGTDPGTKADVVLLRNGKERSVRAQITATQ